MEQPTSEKTIIIDRRYKVLSLISASNNSEVYLVENMMSKEKYAMKMIKNKGILYHLLLNNLKIELSSLKRLEHDHIIKLVDYNLKGELEKSDKTKSKTVSYLILELAENGEIFKYLKSTRGFPIPIAKYFFKQLIEGISTMHSEGIFHRDLKLENLLIDKDFNLKIVDFGFATDKKDDNSVLGTDFYMPPEMVSRKDYECSKCDIFSLGVILFAFIRGSFPFKTTSITDNTYKFFTFSKEDDFWKLYGKTRFTTESIELLNQLFINDPSKRPTVDEILASKFMQGNIADQKIVQEYMSKIRI